MGRSTGTPGGSRRASSSSSSSMRSSMGGSSSGGSRASFSSGRSRNHASASRAGSRSPYSGSSFNVGRGNPTPPPPSRPRRPFFGGWRGGFYRNYGGGYAPAGGCGCLSSILTLAVLFSIVTVALAGLPLCSSTHYATGAQTVSQASAKARTKLSSSECKPIAEWYEDLAEWIDEPAAVETGMKHFYEKTGVQPYLIISTNIEGSKDYSTSQVETYMRNRYDELFGNDDGHLILLFCEPYDGEYDPYLLVGRSAQSVIDVDAEDVIYDAIDTYYSDVSLSNSQYFAKVFTESADTIMARSTTTTTPSSSTVSRPTFSPVLTVVAGVAVAGVLAYFIVRILRNRSQTE